MEGDSGASGGAMAVSTENAKGEQQGSSYTYWVRQVTEEAAPLPVPRKLSSQDILSAQSQPATLGSLWNRVFFPSLSLSVKIDVI